MDDWQSAAGRNDTYTEALSDDLVCEFDVTRTGTDSGATVVGYDHEIDPLDVAIPAIVAHCESMDPCRLPALYDAVNPEALAALFDDERSAESAIGVNFHYAGYSVAIGENMLSVRPAE